MAKGGQGPEGLTGGHANCRTQKKLSVSGCPVTTQKPRNWAPSRHIKCYVLIYSKHSYVLVLKRQL